MGGERQSGQEARAGLEARRGRPSMSSSSGDREDEAGDGSL